MSAGPASPSQEKAQSTPNPILRILLAFTLPLFFVIVFPLTFVSAIHKPAPHELSLLVVGPDQVVATIAHGLDTTDQFNVTQTDVIGEAQRAVQHREVEGAIEVRVTPPATPGAQPTFTVTTYIASAEGRAVAGVVSATGTKIAAGLHAPMATQDLAPLSHKDPQGTNLFYLLTFTSLAAYLVIIVLMQVQPKARLTVRFIAVGLASLIAPLIVFGLSYIFVGDYGASYGTITKLLWVNALYVFTAGSCAILVEQFLGRAATFGVMGLIVFLNFPSAGGAMPAALLPEFWQGMHSIYFGSGAYESFRSIVYFDGNGATRWLLQLGAWSLALVLVNFVVNLTKNGTTPKKRTCSTCRTNKNPSKSPHRSHSMNAPTKDVAAKHAPAFEMPENHLDMVVTPNSVDPQRKASLKTTITSVVAMPLFFLLAFTLCYVSATHAPAPNHMSISIAGPAAVTKPVAAAIEKRAPGAFDITQTTNPATAEQAILDRDAVGAIVIDGNKVTTLTSSGEGLGASGVVKSVGQQVADNMGAQATVKDLAPLPADDATGAVLFFLLALCTVGAFLCTSVISQMIPNVTLKPLLTTNLIAAVAVPVLGFDVISLFVDFETTYGVTAKVIAIAVIYTFTIGVISSLFTLVLKQAAVFAVILLLVAMNFPSAGGTAPGSMLPSFWQAIHSSWVGAGAYESMRSVMYLHGAQLSRWFIQMLIWTAAGLAALFVAARALSPKKTTVAEATPEPEAPVAAAPR